MVRPVGMFKSRSGNEFVYPQHLEMQREEAERPRCSSRPDLGMGKRAPMGEFHCGDGGQNETFVLMRSMKNCSRKSRKEMDMRDIYAAVPQTRRITSYLYLRNVVSAKVFYASVTHRFPYEDSHSKHNCSTRDNPEEVRCKASVQS
jgi:hypothetical protein